MNELPRVLVVDDDTGGRRLTRATLKRAGFDVIEAGDGVQALELLRQGLPDLVLMDVSMPEMDGFTACAELRRLPGGARVPVVMMTGLEDVKSIETAFEVGATDFITKPINWTILAHRVRYMLRASKAINELNQSQRRLSNAQRLAEMGDWEWDLGSGRIEASDQAWQIFGHARGTESAGSETFFGNMPEDDRAAMRLACETAARRGEGFAMDHRVVRSDGRTRHVHQQVEVIERASDGSPARLAGAVHDISRRKEAEEQIRRLAYFDPLTGLPNRLAFGESLHKSLARAERYGHQLAVMFVDLDNFKRVNDTLGHKAGDELLCVASARMLATLRAHDGVARESREGGEHGHSIARLGGDEFIVLLTDLDDPAGAANVARRIVAALAEPVALAGTEVFVGASVGVAVFPQDGADIDTLLKNADTAMYWAKEAGRGNFQFYDRAMGAQALDRLILESSLRRAIERDEFVLHYQPRVDVASGSVVGAEALIRWQHPERGLLLPAQFIPLVESTGMDVAVGEWVIKAACRQAARWIEQGLGVVPVAVNLTSTHLGESSLPRLVARTLDEYRLPAGCLEVEVTESILLAESERSAEIAAELDAMGVRLSIDDFGTGYSSLSYLKRLPIHALKIDRSFVRDIVSDPDDEAIVSAIIALAHNLKLQVVAEGVETSEQLAFLRARRCDAYQGYLTSQPVGAAAFAALLGGPAPASGAAASDGPETARAELAPPAEARRGAPRSADRARRPAPSHEHANPATSTRHPHPHCPT
jgi:diguanylate cyclase (GGDEF)-like protein/PAS domain S-box-containing protein